MADDATIGSLAPPLPSVVAAPLATAYGAGVLLRRWAFDRGWLTAQEPPCFTVSVGGLEAGGTGKTPVASLLLGALHAAGRRPGLLTRGYGRATRGLVVRRPGEPPDPARIGDEPAMIALEHDLPVAACAERVLGASALAELGCDALVLDDGFAHRYLARDVDIVVLRAEAPLGDGRLLPWGSLREPPSSLRRAQVLWFHHRGLATGLPATADGAPAWVAELAPNAAIVTSHAVSAPLCDHRGGAISIPGGAVIAAAGVARPEEVAASLRAQGLEVAGLVPFRDHHVYRARDAERLLASARSAGAAAVVVTAKDAAKLAPLWPGDAPVPLWVTRVRIRISTGAADLSRLLEIPQTWADGP